MTTDPHMVVTLMRSRGVLLAVYVILGVAASVALYGGAFHHLTALIFGVISMLSGLATLGLIERLNRGAR